MCKAFLVLACLIYGGNGRKDPNSSASAEPQRLEARQSLATLLLNLNSRSAFQASAGSVRSNVGSGNHRLLQSRSKVTSTYTSRLRTPLMQDREMWELEEDAEQPEKQEKPPPGRKRAAVRNWFIRTFRPKKYARQQAAAKAKEERLEEEKQRQAGLEAARRQIEMAARAEMARRAEEKRIQQEMEEAAEEERQRKQKEEEEMQKRLAEELANRDPDADRKNALKGVMTSATEFEKDQRKRAEMEALENKFAEDKVRDAEEMLKKEEEELKDPEAYWSKRVQTGTE